MTDKNKTRAERAIELRAEAESLLIDLTLHAHDSFKAGHSRHRLRIAFAEAIALPPDPPDHILQEAWKACDHSVPQGADQLHGICEFCTNPMPDTDGHGLGECVPVCDRCDGSGVDPGPRCESCGTTGDTVRTGDDVDLCEKCAKDIAEPESPAETAQDDEAAIRDAEKRDEDRAKGDEPDPLEDNSILTSADIAELAEGAEMFVGDRVGGPKNRDIAEYEMVCSRSEYVAMARNLERFARENADLRAKLAAYEAHQSYRPLIPGNLIDRIDEHGQEWTRTERVRAAVAELVQPQTVEEITRLQEKLAVAEARIAEMQAIAEGWAFFANVPEGGHPSVKEVNRMLAGMRRIGEVGKGGA